MLKLKYRDFFLIQEKFMLGKKILKKKRRKFIYQYFMNYQYFLKKEKNLNM